MYLTLLPVLHYFTTSLPTPLPSLSGILVGVVPHCKITYLPDLPTNPPTHQPIYLSPSLPTYLLCIYKIQNDDNNSNNSTTTTSNKTKNARSNSNTHTTQTSLPLSRDRQHITHTPQPPLGRLRHRHTNRSHMGRHHKSPNPRSTTRRAGFPFPQRQRRR